MLQERLAFFVAKHVEGEHDEDGEDHDASRGMLERKHRLILQQGLDDGVNIRSVPEDYVPKAVDTAAGEPPFSDVDNPGTYNEFVETDLLGVSWVMENLNRDWWEGSLVSLE